VRTGTRASIGVVAKSVNVHTTLSVGIVASDVPGNGGVGRLRGLLEDDGTRDFGVTSENSDYIAQSVSDRLPKTCYHCDSGLGTRDVEIGRPKHWQ
jgi:hypothetical protein